MPTIGRTEASRRLSPEACRRFFHERSDVSLGLLPQLLLDEKGSDRWGYFWYAARRVDDAIEQGTARADDLRARVQSGGHDIEDEALDLFLADLPPTLTRGSVLAMLDDALAALGRERAWPSPPPMAEFVPVVAAKAGTPLYLLQRMMLPHEPDATVRRLSQLLALSIQLGDDARDLERDRRHGVQTVCQEEAALAMQEFPGEADPVARALPTWREAAATWYALQALESTERVTDPDSRGQARIAVLLWLRAIESGQLREQGRPLRWPAPLGDLISGGPPSAARMAAARRVLRTDPTILGAAAKWDARRRVEAMHETRRKLPPLYVEMGRHLAAPLEGAR